MVIQKLLEQYLSLYDDRINMVITMFVNKFGVRNPSAKWRHHLIERTGFLDEEHQIEYSFHGKGCTVWMADDETISFDFLGGDDYSFDNYKFRLFLESTNAFLEYKSILGNIDDLQFDVEKQDGHFVLKKLYGNT